MAPMIKPPKIAKMPIRLVQMADSNTRTRITVNVEIETSVSSRSRRLIQVFRIGRTTKIMNAAYAMISRTIRIELRMSKFERTTAETMVKIVQPEASSIAAAVIVSEPI